MTTRSRPVPAVRPLPGKAKNRATNEYVSSCSRCRLGIFKSQSYEWGRGQFVGLIHTDCIEGESA